ncbi:MAG: lipopolysaccharide transport periplasmic protein LptA [Gammaproteobacteria bacterium]|nr:lipopolysaccharide transport periplasmic protein LptA [Gammaproteobacteria bacterium]
MTLRANPFPLLPLLLALSSAPALAARTDLDQQILVDAARQSIDIDKGVVLFEGNVVVRQGTLEIRAAALRIDQSRGKGKEVLIATGKPVELRQKLDDGRPLEASAEQVRYELDSRTLTLSGNAQLKQQDSMVKGDTMRYNLAEGRLSAESAGGDGSKRVTAVFTPQQLDKLRDDAGADEQSPSNNSAPTEQPTP